MLTILFTQKKKIHEIAAIEFFYFWIRCFLFSFYFWLVPHLLYGLLHMFWSPSKYFWILFNIHCWRPVIWMYYVYNSTDILTGNWLFVLVWITRVNILWTICKIHKNPSLFIIISQIDPWLEKLTATQFFFFPSFSLSFRFNIISWWKILLLFIDWETALWFSDLKTPPNGTMNQLLKSLWEKTSEKDEETTKDVTELWCLLQYI